MPFWYTLRLSATQCLQEPVMGFLFLGCQECRFEPQNVAIPLKGYFRFQNAANCMKLQGKRTEQQKKKQKTEKRNPQKNSVFFLRQLDRPKYHINVVG